MSGKKAQELGCETEAKLSYGNTVGDSAKNARVIADAIQEGMRPYQEALLHAFYLLRDGGMLRAEECCMCKSIAALMEEQ